MRWGISSLNPLVVFVEGYSTVTLLLAMPGVLVLRSAMAHSLCKCIVLKKTTAHGATNLLTPAQLLSEGKGVIGGRNATVNRHVHQYLAQFSFCQPNPLSRF